MLFRPGRFIEVIEPIALLVQERLDLMKARLPFIERIEERFQVDQPDGGRC